MIKEDRQKKRRTRHFFRNLLIVLFILAVLAIIVVKVFTVKTVEVEGNELYDNTVIENAVLNDEYSWNTLYVFLKYRFFKTKEVPFVDEMTVEIKDPHTLKISVYEKGMMGYLYINGIGENAYFDKDGFVVETSTEIIEDVPKIEGIECDQVVLYEKLPVEADTLKDILNLTQTLKRNDMVPETIQFGVENEPVVHYKNLKIIVGDMDKLTRKVMALSAIMENLKDKAGTLHLEKWTEESTNIVFDPQ